MSVPVPVNYSRVPTDNLYKLMAIGGVALVVTSFYLLFQWDWQVRQMQWEAKVEEAALVKEWEFVKDIYERGAGRPEQKVDWAVVDRIADFARRSETHRTRMEELKKALDPEIRQKGVVGWLATLAGGGLALMSAGFCLWYFRLQRHQDKLLLLEVKKAEAKPA